MRKNPFRLSLIALSLAAASAHAQHAPLPAGIVPPPVAPSGLMQANASSPEGLTPRFVVASQAAEATHPVPLAGSGMLAAPAATMAQVVAHQAVAARVSPNPVTPASVPPLIPTVPQAQPAPANVVTPPQRTTSAAPMMPAAVNLTASPATTVTPPVAGPEAVSSLAPTSSQAAAIMSASAHVADNLLSDIALPDKPKPDAVDLKPSAPARSAHTKSSKAILRGRSVSTKQTEAKHGSVVDTESNSDPYGGVDVIPVSDSQLNRFVYPDAIEDVFFAEGAPLPECSKDAGPMDPCKPIFLNGKHVMLLQLRAGAKGPVQMLVHLHSGDIVTQNLLPGKGVGAIVRWDGAEDGPSDARIRENRLAAAHAQTETMTDSEQNVALLSSFAKGDIPGAFEPESVGAPTRYELYDVIPMASWYDGGNWRVHLMQVKAFGNKPVAINAGLFRSERVRAVALDRDTITARAPAQLYLLEYVPSSDN